MTKSLQPIHGANVPTPEYLISQLYEIDKIALGIPAESEYTSLIAETRAPILDQMGAILASQAPTVTEEDRFKEVMVNGLNAVRTATGQELLPLPINIERANRFAKNLGKLATLATEDIARLLDSTRNPSSISPNSAPSLKTPETNEVIAPLPTSLEEKLTPTSIDQQINHEMLSVKLLEDGSFVFKSLDGKVVTTLAKHNDAKKDITVAVLKELSQYKAGVIINPLQLITKLFKSTYEPTRGIDSVIKRSPEDALAMQRGYYLLGTLHDKGIIDWRKGKIDFKNARHSVKGELTILHKLDFEEPGTIDQTIQNRVLEVKPDSPSVEETIVSRKIILDAYTGILSDDAGASAEFKVSSQNMRKIILSIGSVMHGASLLGESIDARQRSRIDHGLSVISDGTPIVEDNDPTLKNMNRLLSEQYRSIPHGLFPIELKTVANTTRYDLRPGVEFVLADSRPEKPLFNDPIQLKIDSSTGTVTVLNVGSGQMSFNVCTQDPNVVDHVLKGKDWNDLIDFRCRLLEALTSFTQPYDTLTLPLLGSLMHEDIKSPIVRHRISASLNYISNEISTLMNTPFLNVPRKGLAVIEMDLNRRIIIVENDSQNIIPTTEATTTPDKTPIDVPISSGTVDVHILPKTERSRPSVHQLIEEITDRSYGRMKAQWEAGTFEEPKRWSDAISMLMAAADNDFMAGLRESVLYVNNLEKYRDLQHKILVSTWLSLRHFGKYEEIINTLQQREDVSPSILLQTIKARAHAMEKELLGSISANQEKKAENIEFIGIIGSQLQDGKVPNPSTVQQAIALLDYLHTPANYAVLCKVHGPKGIKELTTRVKSQAMKMLGYYNGIVANDARTTGLNTSGIRLVSGGYRDDATPSVRIKR